MFYTPSSRLYHSAQSESKFIARRSIESSSYSSCVKKNDERCGEYVAEFKNDNSLLERHGRKILVTGWQGCLLICSCVIQG